MLVRAAGPANAPAKDIMVYAFLHCVGSISPISRYDMFVRKHAVISCLHASGESLGLAAEMAADLVAVRGDDEFNSFHCIEC